MKFNYLSNAVMLGGMNKGYCMNILFPAQAVTKRAEVLIVHSG